MASVLDNTEIIRVVTVPGARLIAAHVTVGGRMPAYRASTGRILLGGLSEQDLQRILKTSHITRRTKYSITSILELKRIVRRDHKRGWSLLDQEFEEGSVRLLFQFSDPDESSRR